MTYDKLVKFLSTYKKCSYVPNKPKVKYLFNGRIERKSFLVDYGYLNTKQLLHSNGNMFTINIDNIIKIGKEVN